MFVKTGFVRSLQFVRKMSSVIVQKEGHITTIGINNPEKRNCVSIEIGKQLKKAVEDFENDDNAYAGVLYGCGGNFCAGYDLEELSKGNAHLIGAEEIENGFMGPTLRYIKKPLVAAVSGYAVAGGLELSLMCDLRVVEESAIMGVFCRRFGVPLLDGGTVRLQAIVGLGRALDLVLTGRPVTAKEAFEMGLANRVVPVGTSLGQAINLATSLVKYPQKCMNADRKSVYNAAYAGAYKDCLRFETQNSLEIVQMESVDGAKRFKSGVGKHGKFQNLTEKPVPDWEAEENKHKPIDKSKL